MQHSQSTKDKMKALSELGFSSREIAKLVLGSETKKSSVNRVLKVIGKNGPELLAPVTGKEGKKILFISDCQVKPGVDLTYLEAIGQYIVDKKPDVVVNVGDFWDFESLSSYDKGKLSFEGRRLQDDIEIGKIGMAKLLGPLKNYQKSNNDYNPRLVFTLGNHECLTQDSEVLTKDGFKNYTELTEQDEVLTLTNELSYEWNKPDLVFEKEYKGKLHSYESRSFSSLNTPGHRMYHITSGGNLAVKDSTEMCENFSVVAAVKSMNVGVQLSDKEIQLAAWLCTDSHFPERGSAILYQREGNASKIRNLLVDLGVPFTEKTRQRDIEAICGKVLKKPCQPSVEFYLKKCETLDKLGVTTNANLPVWVKDISDNQWDVFLETLIDADGTIPTNAVRSRVFYGKKAICDDVQIQASLHGWCASLTEYRPNQWRVNLVKRTVRKQEGLKKSEVEYDGKVWCLNVKNENFFIRRNGKCHFTGNCRLKRIPEGNSEFEGFIGYHLLELEKDWEVYDFLKPVNIQGINFVHYLANPMSGKPYGGSAASQLKSVGTSFCVGHKQTLEVAIQPVLDGTMRLGIICGAAYPFDEGYKGYQGNNHFRGVVMLHDAKDGFADPSFISTKFLIDRLNKS